VRHAAVAVVCATLALLAPASASANGRFPTANQLVFSPSDPQLVILRATFGFVLSHDGGHTWAWLCEDALGLSPASETNPPIAITAKNSIIAGVYLGLPNDVGGLDVSSDTGCSWGFVGDTLANHLFVDLAVRPDTPDAVVVLTSDYGAAAGADGGSGYTTTVSETTDDGATWSTIGAPLDPSIFVTSIEVAATDPQRIYVSGVRGAGGNTTAWILASTDHGATWIEEPTPFDANTESYIYIGAVDPTNADTFYVRTFAPGGSRLFITTDGGHTFSIATLPLTGEMLGFAVSPDGAQVYAGSKEDGLFEAPRGSLSFQRTSTVPILCLATEGADVWACSTQATGFTTGMSADHGVTFTPMLDLLGIAGPLACGADAGAAVCTTVNDSYVPPYEPFLSLCSLLEACDTDAGSMPLVEACTEAGACPSSSSGHDAGAGGSSGGGSGGSSSNGGGGGGSSGGSSSGGTSEGSPGGNSCGCSVVGGGEAAGAALAVGALALLARRRRASRR
jgi:MYXO-CTERM domain-containing protein